MCAKTKENQTYKMMKSDATSTTEIPLWWVDGVLHLACETHSEISSLHSQQVGTIWTEHDFLDSNKQKAFDSDAYSRLSISDPSTWIIS